MKSPERKRRNRVAITTTTRRQDTHYRSRFTDKIVKALGILLLALLPACEEPRESANADAAGTAVESDHERNVRDVNEKSGGENKATASVPVTAVVDGLNDLTFRLYRAIPPGAGGNLFLSPYSVSQAIAPLALGARGETAAEILAFLGAGAGGDAGAGDGSDAGESNGFHAANHELAARAMAIPDGDPTTFRIANRMWHEQTLPWETSFRDAVKQSYGSGAEPADFRGNADGERKKINTWIGDQTEQKIPNLLPEGSLTANTRLVLANAIYFLGEWKDAFDPENTKPLPFHIATADSVETPFLVRTGSYRAASVKKTWVLELPYEGDKFSMVVLLPAERGGLPALEEKLTLDTLQSWTAKLETRKIDVFLPKFEMRTKASLEKPLAAMGLALPFDPARADFTGISAAEKLWVDRVFHEAFVRVDEKGTEAAAATATTMRTLSMPPPNPEFRADHPFVFVIRENETGLILFVGRVGNPAAGS